ncbi:hypothetical protein BDL97_05G044400 [Sphagnum fallax]|nr:hypothetical protein BDL97_05G044400 [Sphagnum fallax]
MGLYAAAHDWSRVAGSASASLLCGRGAAAEGMNEMAGSTQLYQLQHSSLVSGSRAPFTSGQWAEFAHQDLIFKYMMAGLNVPQELLNPICSRSTGPAGLMNSMTSSCHNAANLRWGPAIHRSGVQSSTDLEPGRCRRTDGKKWRCGRDVVPDQKYCEKHVHRGRQRPRRNAVELGPHAAAAATGSSPSATSSSSGAAATAVHVSAGTTNVGPIRTSSTTSGGGTSGSSCFSLSSCLQQQQHRPSSNLSVKSCFSSSHSSPSPGSGGGSSPAGSSQFGQLPSLTSSPSAVAAASTFASKDYSRYLAASSVMKSDQQQGIGSEQQHSILSSETLGSTARGQGHETSQMLSNLSRLQSVNQSWHSLLSSKVPAAHHESKVNSNSCSSGLLHFGHSTSSPQLTRGQLLGQDFGLLSDQTGGQVDHVTHSMSAAQQQAQAYHAVSNASYGSAESVSVQARRESEGQPLRHFFDDWPRSRDRSAMTSWGSGSVDEPDQEHSNSDINLSTHLATPSINNTQLSISIPITAAASSAHEHPGSPTADFWRDHAIRYGVAN